MWLLCSIKSQCGFFSILNLTSCEQNEQFFRWAMWSAGFTFDAKSSQPWTVRITFIILFLGHRPRWITKQCTLCTLLTKMALWVHHQDLDKGHLSTKTLSPWTVSKILQAEPRNPDDQASAGLPEHKFYIQLKLKFHFPALVWVAFLGNLSHMQRRSWSLYNAGAFVSAEQDYQPR